MSKHNQKAVPDLQSRIEDEIPSSQWTLQLNEKSGLSYDYLNELHSRVLILKTKNEEFYSELQKPLPTYAQYCGAQNDGALLLERAKPDSLYWHNFFVRQFNEENSHAKKSLEVVQAYVQSFSHIIKNIYPSFAKLDEK